MGVSVCPWSGYGVAPPLRLRVEPSVRDSRIEPVPSLVRRVRVSRSEDVSPERPDIAKASVSGRRAYLGEPDSFFERALGWLDGDGRCSVSIGGDAMLTLDELGAAALYDVASPDEDVRALVNAAREEALMERGRRNLAVDRELSLFLPGLVNIWICTDNGHDPL